MTTFGDLKDYSLEELEFDDQRLPTVIFTVPFADNIELTSEENTFAVENPYGIEEIINSDIAQPSFSIDVSDFPGTVVEWDIIPQGLTVTENQGVFTISPILDIDTYDIVRSPIITIPEQFQGVFFYTPTVSFTSPDGIENYSWQVGVFLPVVQLLAEFDTQINGLKIKNSGVIVLEAFVTKLVISKKIEPGETFMDAEFNLTADPTLFDMPATTLSANTTQNTIGNRQRSMGADFVSVFNINVIETFKPFIILHGTNRIGSFTLNDSRDLFKFLQFEFPPELEQTLGSNFWNNASVVTTFTANQGTIQSATNKSFTSPSVNSSLVRTPQGFTNDYENSLINPSNLSVFSNINYFSRYWEFSSTDPNTETDTISINLNVSWTDENNNARNLQRNFVFNSQATGFEIPPVGEIFTFNAPGNLPIRVRKYNNVDMLMVGAGASGTQIFSTSFAGTSRANGGGGGEVKHFENISAENLLISQIGNASSLLDTNRDTIVTDITANGGVNNATSSSGNFTNGFSGGGGGSSGTGQPGGVQEHYVRGQKNHPGGGAGGGGAVGPGENGTMISTSGPLEDGDVVSENGTPIIISQPFSNFQLINGAGGAGFVSDISGTTIEYGRGGRGAGPESVPKSPGEGGPTFPDFDPNLSDNRGADGIVIVKTREKD